MHSYLKKEETLKKKVYKDISDPVADSLIFKIQAGDTTVFPLLMERCESLLKRATYRPYIRGYEREDLYQEACVVLVEAIEKYDFARGMSFNQYVCLRLDNHFGRLVRRSNALKRKSDKDSLSLDGVMEENGFQLAGPSLTLQPEDKPIVKEVMEEYITYLSSFEKKVCLYCCLGYSYDDIAEELKCDRGKVLNAKHRCTEKYKKNFM